MVSLYFYLALFSILHWRNLWKMLGNCKYCKTLLLASILILVGASSSGHNLTLSDGLLFVLCMRCSDCLTANLEFICRGGVFSPVLVCLGLGRCRGWISIFLRNRFRKFVLSFKTNIRNWIEGYLAKKLITI